MGRSFEQKITENLGLTEVLLRKKSARETCADCSFKKVRICRTLSVGYPAAPDAVSRWQVAAKGHQLLQAVPSAVACRKLPPPRPVPRRACRKLPPPRLSPDQSEQKRGRDDDAGSHVGLGGEDPLMVLNTAPGVEQETGREHQGGNDNVGNAGREEHVEAVN